MALPQVSQQFCVRWNSYHANLQVIFPRLLCTQQFADVTLACESEMVRCHKVVLSACSTYFEKLLTNNPCKHPIIFMKDMRFSEVQQLVEFMYRGEVNVTQEELPSLLRAAESLQIRGLCGPDSNGSNPPPKEDQSQVPPAATNPVTEPLKQYLGPNSTEDFLKATYAAKSSRDEPLEPEVKKSKLDHSGDSQEDIKEDKEVILEDGVYYGEMDHDDTSNDKHEEDSAEGSSGMERGLGLDSQTTSDLAIANVTCEYEDTCSAPESPELVNLAGPPGTTAILPSGTANDHNYDSKDLIEPPAFIIKQSGGSRQLVIEGSSGQTQVNTRLVAVSHKLVGLNLVTLNAHGGASETSATASQSESSLTQSNSSYSPTNSVYKYQDVGNTKRIRRSEVLLKQAADCVSRGQTFQNVSDQFNIPISTIRFFMARKGILPRRKRGRSSQAVGPGSSGMQSVGPASPTEPPYHMQHYKLPDMVAMTCSQRSNIPGQSQDTTTIS